MIVDCFPYFKEKELLELRLRLLYDVVDLFIITEGSYTHKGIPKSFTALDAIKALGIPLNKIKVVQVPLPHLNEESDHWVRERMQRNVAANFITNKDVAFVSDCDEIVDPTKIKYFAQMALSNPSKIIRLPLDYLCGSAKWRLHHLSGSKDPIGWTAPFVCLRHHLDAHSMSEIRESRAWELDNLDFEEVFLTENNAVEPAGWHFCWMGGSASIADKQQYFLHDDVYTANPNAVLKANSPDIFGREDHVITPYDISNLLNLVFKLPHIKNYLQI